MTIEQRINRLEKLFKSPEGTYLTRVLHPKKGTQWNLMLGQMGQPWKKNFTANTIEKCINMAEKKFLKIRH